ncbi:carbonyl reductase [NADPH] 1-like [Coccinella septempunctata]|uniref:carbonyl reductase [NADPH] 1-like n=1 Tax=Coccinella septempunctata TaxID=41139 RepID=UPI001D095791|nr:carbonyl reductase [NADPH] 1-like [Coccinella septempunctata]
MAEKIAVVTGSNKGIGYAIVKGLCERFDGKVYLTARDVSRGKEAVKKLNELGFQPLFHQLDITDQNSIDKFKEDVLKQHGGIDILVNNAAIAFKNDARDPFSKQAEETIAVNYFSLLRVCNSLFPLLRQNGRVVNISSSAGHLSRIPSEDLRKKLGDKSLTIDSLSRLMEKFVSDAKVGKHTEEGWGNSAYVVSKVGCSALSFIQQRLFDNEKPCRNISVNAVHPGYVDTDMTSHKGHLTIEEGAAAPLYLALEDHGLKEKYVWHDKRVVDWYGETPAIY